MDFVVAQLALVFMPGIIWARIDAKYGNGLRPDQTTLLIRAFLFGLATYSTLFLIYSAFGKEFGYSTLGSDTDKIDLIELADEIAWSVPLSFVLSIVWLWAVRYKLLMKFLHKINASRRYGDEDVWSYTFNSDEANVEYVHFRDLENGYIFAGWVNTYSESEENRELLLRDAIIYDEYGDEISAPPFVYLCRPKGNIWIEFPYKNGSTENVGKETNDKNRH